ncbi:hypothetical protein PENTCL1PPCAC_9163, partial [Pristionchus entomophagus]
METITIHANRTIKPNENLMLQIIYRGVAKMDEYGLYENWDPKLNKSLHSNGPYILASSNFPTGARYWIPCFDEPNMKATFELRVNHPSGLNVYSNTDVKTSESRSNGLFPISFSFLEKHFLGENTTIRRDQMSQLARRGFLGQWREMHQFFFRNAANFTNHRFDLLADTVLNMEKDDHTFNVIYPDATIIEDYLKELRDFLIRNPRRAASMSTEI